MPLSRRGKMPPVMGSYGEWGITSINRTITNLSAAGAADPLMGEMRRETQEPARPIGRGMPHNHLPVGATRTFSPVALIYHATQ